MAQNASTPIYSGIFSDIYDLFYAHKTYQQETAFIQSLFQKYGGEKIYKILELGSGTGNHSFILEKQGHEIVAIDLSASMIEKAILKGQAMRSSVKFSVQDMVELEQEEKPFDAVICLFDSICYVLKNSAIEQLLHRVHAHLKPAGLFIFEFWNAAAMLNHLDPIRINRLQHGDEQIIKISEAKLDIKNQLYKVDYSLYELKADGQYQLFTEQHINRYYQIQEMAYFLNKAKFQPLKWYAGYSNSEEITDKTWNILCVAQT